LEQGIDDYITKPFSSSYLKARIASLFTKRKQLQEIFMKQLSANNETDNSKEWTPSEPEVMPHDKLFMKEVMDFLEEQIDNPDLVIDDFANKLLLSRSIFYRKLKSIVGMPPVDFIREIRVKRAAQLIRSDVYNFSQIAYMTGFSDPKYFSRCFKKHMGVTPSEYKNSINNEDNNPDQ
jgi:AraC-like DNA-binding protein